MFFLQTLSKEIACFQSNLENSSNQVEPTHIEAHWGHTLTRCGYQKTEQQGWGHMMASMICTMALNMATVYKWENHNRKSYYFEWSKCKHGTFPGFQDIFDDVPPGKGQIGQVDLGRRSFSFNSMGKVSLVLTKSQVWVSTFSGMQPALLFSFHPWKTCWKMCLWSPLLTFLTFSDLSVSTHRPQGIGGSIIQVIPETQ